jgi:phytoene dehydrogenase-like protein
VKKKICVIGAGLGGLSASIRLANKGFEVDLYEQNNTPGGKAGEIKERGYRFDTGPSLLTMPQVMKDLFSDCNENLEDYLKINRLDLICKYFYPINQSLMLIPMLISLEKKLMKKLLITPSH